jgi:glycogen operon protein
MNCARSTARPHPATSGTATCRRRAGLVYGCARTAPGGPTAATASTRNKLLLDPWAREIVGQFDLARRAFGADRPSRCTATARQRRHALKAGWSMTTSTGAGTAHRTRRWTETVLYELHVKGFTRCRQRRARAAARHLCRAGPSRRWSPTCSAGRHRGQPAAGAPAPRRGAPGADGPASTTGATTRSGLLLPGAALASAADGRGAARRVPQPWCARCTRPASRCCWTWSTTTRPRATRTGPTISWRGLDNAGYYRLPARRTVHYENHSGCGNTLDMRHPRVLQLVMDSLRYWVHRDACRRLPLRPGAGAGPRRPWLRRQGAFFKAVAQDPVLAGASR